ncbi:putative Holliday junction resolvase-like endonuclease [Peribacillus deserti]|uniref:Holliday junction resolvase-like endonuclease n=1 Tax=Peribacillus deserti TaxID=673318 RepID=A0ABS2QL72_9BACI|nr:hypothetical protein [Peribacillus deserti]MBM7693913.1 putative Holliday junction resolvase-like endonuclease [Peribacillus deserti]
MDQLLFDYAKEGIFLALFLYLLIWTIPKIKQEFKQEMKEMESRYNSEMEKMEKRHSEDMEKLEKRADERESELMKLLNMFEDKYDILTYKVEEVLKKIQS